MKKKKKKTFFLLCLQIKEAKGWATHRFRRQSPCRFRRRRGATTTAACRARRGAAALATDATFGLSWRGHVSHVPSDRTRQTHG
jgi:hypothetical protein